MKDFFRCAPIFMMPILCFGNAINTEALQSAYLDTQAVFKVVLPDGYESMANKRFPVLYFLHAAGYNAEMTFDSVYADLDAYIDDYEFIVVIPNNDQMAGDSLGWWLDSPLREKSQYSSFLVEELKPYIDNKYRTLPDRSNTGIAGHSMGGFGAFHNALEHSDVFGVMCGIKSALDLRYPFNSRWRGNTFGLRHVLGEDPDNYAAVNVLARVDELSALNTKIRFYNGLEDLWFEEENKELHELLMNSGVVHEYIELEGQKHPTVPPELMKEVLDYFSNSFSSAGIIPGRGFRSLPTNAAGRRAAVAGQINMIGQSVQEPMRAPQFYVVETAAKKSRLSGMRF